MDTDADGYGMEAAASGHTESMRICERAAEDTAKKMMQTAFPRLID